MKISDIILGWYKKNRRDLPWRETKEPYNVWLSEVILQQTRVQQGLEYYNRFTKEFPDVYALAAAHEDQVLKRWQGLGYYSRARNLHAASRQVVQEYNGTFPGNSRELMKLKGVGQYTAAAVASIAFNEPVAVVDGNVIRVISRIFGISKSVDSPDGKKEIFLAAEKMLNRNEPGDHNQAMMEFGALQCVPVNPNCLECPLKNYCEAFSSNRVKDLPVKNKKKPVTKRYFLYMVIQFQDFIFIKQRNNDDIWKKLYEFPLLETDKPVTDQLMVEKISSYLGVPEGEIVVEHISNEIKHLLSHRTIVARFVHLKLQGKESNIKFSINNIENKYLQDLTDESTDKVTESDMEGDGVWANLRGSFEDNAGGAIEGPDGNWIRVTFGDLEKYPVPRLIDRYLDQLN